MDVTDDGIETLFSDEHPLKAEDSMDVTDDGIETLVSDEQQLKAHFPMDLTDDVLKLKYIINIFASLYL